MKFLSLLLITFFSFANLTFSNSEHAQFSAFSSTKSVQIGEEFDIIVKIKFAKHWYSYDIKDQINVEGIGPTTTEIYIKSTDLASQNGNLEAPKPIVKYDEGFEMDIAIFKEEVSFVLPAKALKDIDFSKDALQAGVFIQLCDTARCLPPEEFLIDVKYNEAIIKQGYKSKSVSVPSNIEEAKDKGIFSFLWFAMGAGAFALLTPCVFPMIPITVSFFTKRAEKNNGGALRDSIVYALGIILTFTILGFLMALLFGATGIRDFASNPWVNMAIATIFVVFALNLFGAFEIQIPPSILNKLNMKSNGSGIGAVLLMGLTFSLTSFTCTVPFVGTALISASEGEWFYPIIGMLGFSSVFAAPFFLLALFPQLLKSLPKSGGWMNNIKVVMGYLEIAAALKFISNADLVLAWGILPRELFIAIWMGCGLLITTYVLGFYRMALDSVVQHVSAMRAVFAILFLGFTLFLSQGLFQRPLGELDAFFPPQEYLGDNLNSTNNSQQNIVFGKSIGASSQYTDEDWEKDLDKAMIRAKAEGKNLFIDFTGWTCTNCRWMEKNMFPQGDIAELMGNYIKVKLYTDRQNEEEVKNKNLQMTMFNSIDLPLYVVMTPDMQVLGKNAFTRNKDEFKDFLKIGTK